MSFSQRTTLTLSLLSFALSTVELVGSSIDHKVKYNSASTEPAWKTISDKAGTQIWRIEDFEVVHWPQENYGSFFEGDSYIVLHSYKKTPDQEGLSCE